MNWQLKRVKTSELKEYPHNPRVITKKGLADLKKSITKFGLAEPIVINTDHTICGGHGRLKVLQDLKIENVDCYLPERLLTAIEFKELNIRLNKNIAGEFDFDILANFFELDNLKEWGFAEKELDMSLFIDSDKLDEVPDVTEEPISQVGDLFLLNGKHRLLCGDSTKKEDVDKLMDEKKADMVFTDPPYGVSYAEKNKYLNSISPGNRIQTNIANDHLTEEDTNIFWFNSFSIIKNYLNKIHSYCFFSPQIQGMMMMMMMKAELPYRHVLIWVKNNHVLGRTDYNYKHEPILFGWKKDGTHKFYGAGNQTTSVWNYNKPQKSDLHPTMKPVELVVNAILNSSAENQIILDPFLGSGTTLIASEQTSRTCYGMEIDPIYVDVILKRYKNLYPDKEIKCLNREFNFKKLFNA